MFGNLGDAFPQEFIDRFSEDKIKTGTVIRAKVKDTNPSKIKRFIIIGIDGEKVSLATVFINSEINPNIFPTLELQNAHLFLESENRDYLDNDSFVDCSTLIERSVEDLIDLIRNNPSTCIGEVNSLDMEIIKKKIKTVKTISINLKKKYSLFL